VRQSGRPFGDGLFVLGPVDSSADGAAWGTGKERVRMGHPDILEVSELINLFGQLAHRDRAMVLLDEPFAEVTAPNQLWCMDFKGWFRTGDGNRCDPFTITDAYNRYLIHCREVARMDTAHVLAICEAAMCEYRLWGLIRSTAHKSIASGKPG
jgi:transposase InsO family protein